VYRSQTSTRSTLWPPTSMLEWSRSVTPDDPASHFATIWKPGSGWHVETISAFDTPAYTGEKVPDDLLPLLVSPEWVEERKIRWGVNSPIYQSKVLGEFPDLSDDTLILPKWIEAAQKRSIKRTKRPDHCRRYCSFRRGRDRDHAPGRRLGQDRPRPPQGRHDDYDRAHRERNA
jgi:hypothetical protein